MYLRGRSDRCVFWFQKFWLLLLKHGVPKPSFQKTVFLEILLRGWLCVVKG